MLVVTEDELPDGGTGTNVSEKLVLHGSVGEMRVGTLRFTLWDAAVPACRSSRSCCWRCCSARAGIGARLRHGRAAQGLPGAGGRG